MKVARFTESGHTRLGLVTADGIVDLSRAAPDLPPEMEAFLAAGPEAWRRAREAEGSNADFPLDAVRLEVPIPRPGKVLAIGLNYADHIAESGMKTPEHQLWFNKQHDCITGPDAAIEVPAVAPDYVDYEAELVMVIGLRARHVPADRAEEVIFGYTCGNDVSVRDWQIRSQTMTMGKSFVTHGPIGPWIVSADEFGDPHDAAVRCFVNGEMRQDSNTRHLIFDCFQQIAHLSAAFPLNPGDVIFTGTPHGVGGAMSPPAFLKAGDRVRVEIDRIGALENPVEHEDKQTVIG
ncbi:MAG: fumarylacetoacetate hydrolase family protein [Pseudomonadota bacterium]|nr:fumarylacetoacetate hydrolase family protein [Pseudomonadota bacterium]